MSEIKFRVGNKNDKERVGLFLRENYFPDEPISKSVNYTADDATLDMMLRCLESGTSTIAEDAAGKLIGVRLAKRCVPEDIENMKIERPETILDRMWVLRHILAVGANAFERYKVDKVMHSVSLGVDKEYRGRGLGKQLYLENMKLARDLGYRVYACNCSSLFSTKACLKLGFEIIFEVPYVEFLGSEGVQVFQTKPPHDKVRVLAKVL